MPHSCHKRWAGTSPCCLRLQRTTNHASSSTFQKFPVSYPCVHPATRSRDGGHSDWATSGITCATGFTARSLFWHKPTAAPKRQGLMAYPSRTHIRLKIAFDPSVNLLSICDPFEGAQKVPGQGTQSSSPLINVHQPQLPCVISVRPDRKLHSASPQPENCTLTSRPKPRQHHKPPVVRSAGINGTPYTSRRAPQARTVRHPCAEEPTCPRRVCLHAQTPHTKLVTKSP